MKSACVLLLLAGMGMGQEKPCPSFESFAQDIARRHILKESLVDDAFSVECLPSLLSDATAKRVNEIEAERLDLKPEPQFVPAVKVTVECGKGCATWNWTCEDGNRVLLQSENRKIAVCMKVAE